VTNTFFVLNPLTLLFSSNCLASMQTPLVERVASGWK
jgi:hypothetical protein